MSAGILLSFSLCVCVRVCVCVCVCECVPYYHLENTRTHTLIYTLRHSQRCTVGEGWDLLSKNGQRGRGVAGGGGGGGGGDGDGDEGRVSERICGNIVRERGGMYSSLSQHGEE